MEREVLRGPVRVRVTIDSRGKWTVPFGGPSIEFEGQPLRERVVTVLQRVYGSTDLNPTDRDAMVRDVVNRLCDACWEVEQQQPTGSLAGAEAADRAFEVLTSLTFTAFNAQGQHHLALNHTLWILKATLDWEVADTAILRRVHKGAPYFFAAISALMTGNVDLGLRLLEDGDLEDSETYRRAGLSESGVKFPGRLTMQLDPTPQNLLHSTVIAMRTALDAQIREFNEASGLPPGTALSIADVDGFLLRNGDTVAESRYLFGYLLWAAITLSDPRFAWIPSLGRLTLRRKAEWVLGLLTATEGILRTVPLSKRMPGHYVNVLAAVAGSDLTGTSDPDKEARKRIDAVDKRLNASSIGSCLDFWGAERGSQTSTPAGLPWYMGWLEPARFMRNQAAHLVATDTEYDSRWAEIDKTARFSLLCGVWLLKRKAGGPSALRAGGTPSGPSPIH